MKPLPAQLDDWSWHLSVAMLLLCVGCSTDSAGENGPHSSADEQKKDVCLIASGDTQGWLIPCGCTANQSGGLIRRATYVKSQQDKFQTLVVDVGGATDGAAPYQAERFKAILKGEAAMGVAAHNLGQNELLLGPDRLIQLSKQTGVPFVSANAESKTEGEIAQKHLIISDENSKQKIAVIGVVSTAFATEEISVTSPEAAVLKQVGRLPKDVDRIVVLAYLPMAELRKLAAQLPEVDIMIGGPTGQALRPEKVGQTTLMSATNKGKFLAEVKFGSSRDLDEARIVEISSDLKEDVQQDQNLLEFREFLAERDFTARESGFVKTSVAAIGSTASVAGTESCRGCHSETNDHWDSTGHSHAWQTLVNDGAHVDSYCQQCHATGFGQPRGFASAKTTPLSVDVGCESCHGPSAEHVADSNVNTPFDAVGQCRSCHDAENSPLFEYDSYWEKVRHGL